ncbi:hypothetical protein QBC40DRAFT_318486, partial [Triangularia verruculosa]
PFRSIVFIHGINGDPIKTWEYVRPSNDRKSNAAETVLWPRDLLPRAFPNARVLSFGYNGNLYRNRNESTPNIRELAHALLSDLTGQRQDIKLHRPIIFIAHCLGGLVVRKALHVATYNVRFHGVFEETIGILFFGTPHIPSAIDAWDHYAKFYPSFDRPAGRLSIGRPKRSRLVKTLQRDSEELIDLMTGFSGNTVPRWAIVSFYEPVKIPGAKALIVSATAAQLDIPDEIQRPIHADHATMCRFWSERDPTFREVCAEIKNMT